MSDDADNKVFNLAKLFSSHADKFGYKVGEKLPTILESLLKSFAKRGQIGEDFEELVPGAHTLISKGVEFLANVFELPKDEIKKVIPGFLGDMVYETLNEAIDAMGRGAGEAPKNGKKPDEEPKAADAVKLDPGQMKGFVVGGQLHKSNCTTASRPRASKGEKSPEDITVLDAVKRRHALSYCGCWGTPSEVEALEAQVKASIVPASEPKATQAEVKAETSASAPEKPKAKGVLFNYMQRFRKEEPLLFMQIVDGAYRPLTAEDHGLKTKFFQAFNSDTGACYEDFLALIMSPNANWHQMLDELIGEPKKDQSKWKREIEQFSVWCQGVSAELRDSTKAFKATCAARDATRTRNAKATKYVVSFTALVGVVAYFALINNPF